ncbi:hypothetical protein CTI12_AA302190 [Artemisia annua]|uniref:Uncharacterized protein n=1 Tax=Artemisia annua TaxID=35608 RepID=A0A2U1N6B5_ARTAN|nr:hypothetical protein CTI12_AA302190 [Artemisia annua]
MKLEWMRRSKVGAENTEKRFPGMWKVQAPTLDIPAGLKASVHIVTNGRKKGKRASKVDMFKSCTRETKVKVFGVIQGQKKVLTTYKESVQAVDGVGLDSSNGHGTSSYSTPVDNEANIQAQVNARVESRLEDVRKEMKAEMRCLVINKRPCLLTTALTDF